MLGQRERDEEAERPKQDIAAKVDEEYKKLEKDLARLDLMKLNSEGKKSLAGWRSHMKILKTFTVQGLGPAQPKVKAHAKIAVMFRDELVDQLPK